MNIKEIEKALRLHCLYDGNYSRHGCGKGFRGSEYLYAMDKLTFNYSGAPGIRLSKMLHDYYKVVDVENLDEALERLRKLDGKK